MTALIGLIVYLTAPDVGLITTSYTHNGVTVESTGWVLTCGEQAETIAQQMRGSKGTCG